MQSKDHVTSDASMKPGSSAHLVREIRRVIKPDGNAVLLVPRIDGLLTVTMLALGLQPPAIECSLLQRYGSPEAEPESPGTSRTSPGAPSNNSYSRRASEWMRLRRQAFIRVGCSPRRSLHPGLNSSDASGDRRERSTSRATFAVSREILWRSGLQGGG